MTHYYAFVGRKNNEIESGVYQLKFGDSWVRRYDVLKLHFPEGFSFAYGSDEDEVLNTALGGVRPSPTLISKFFQNLFPNCNKNFSNKNF